MFTECEVTLAWTIAMQIRGAGLRSCFPTCVFLCLVIHVEANACLRACESRCVL